MRNSIAASAAAVTPIFAVLAAGLLTGTNTLAQAPGTQDGEWHFIGGDSAHTRYSPADEIDADNFEDLEEAWVWDGASFNAASGRSTPTYIDGMLFTVAGPRRHVVAIDPETGETIWSYREPHTRRHEYSMRKDYGKGVAYGEVDGRGVIYIISPAFILTALDAKTGKPLAGFGKPIGVDGFPTTGVVDLLADLGHEYDAYEGLPLETGYGLRVAQMTVTPNLLIHTGNASDGTPTLYAVDKQTGERLASIEVPAESSYGMMTYVHNGKQYIMLQTRSTLTAMALGEF